MQESDNGCRQIHLQPFPTGVAGEEDVRLAVHHIPHIQQLFGLVADHFWRHLLQAVDTEEDHQRHDRHDQQRPA